MIDKQTKLLASNLYEFIKNKYKFDRDVDVEYKFDDANSKRILGKTGYYDPDSEQIVIFCANRHPKDILRSLAHELIHHVQKCEGSFDPEEATSAYDENYILHDKKLKMLEADAFLEGNISLREWEAHMKEDNQDPVLQEAKKDRKLSTAKLKKAKEMATSMEKKQGYSAEKAHKIAYAAVQKEASELENVSEGVAGIVHPEVTVVVNDALKDSVVYRPEDRACNDLYNGRDELIYQQLLKKLGIKK